MTMGLSASQRNPRARIQALLHLPPLSPVARELLIELGKAEIEIPRLVQVIERDPGLTARVIGVANSAYFNPQAPIYDIAAAVVRVLGLDMVKHLALGIALSAPFDTSGCPRFKPDRYWCLAVQTATLATHLAPCAKLEPGAQEYLFVGALLHNIGEMVLIHSFLEGMCEVLALSDADANASIPELQEKILGLNGTLDQADKDPVHCKPRKPMTFHLGQGIIGMAAETGHLQHCRDCPSESRFLPPERRIGNEVIGSLICAPIHVNGRVLGVVNVSHSEPHSFNDTHERLLQVFASFLGQILSNWRYYHEMEQEIQHRTVELQQALSEAEELKRRYHQLSIIDELTNLHNRRFFFSEANTALSVAVRHRQPFSVLMVDLDHFKRINDTHGHAMGDRILQITAALMKAQVREGDILARFGGEEFALALPNTGAEGAKQMSERILEALRAVHFNTEQGEPVRVTASIGIATCEDETMKQKDDRLEQMLRQADQALYAGKAEGRNRSCAYSDVAFRM